jgi:CDP-2,3-bis-(O-geranylgeranyl)-sn-glycerol synthase
MNHIWFALIYFLPAGLANGAPPMAKKVPWLNRLDAPMDFGLEWRGKRLLGDHKTWRGVVLAVLTGIVFAGLEYPLFYKHGHIVPQLSLPRVLLLGALLGLGAILGDAVKSFFKRQWGVASGRSWFPFDQIDYIIGGLLLSSLVVRLSAVQYVVTFLVWFVAHLFGGWVGYKIGVKDTWI